MLAIKNIGDWIEVIIAVLIIGGSALGGIVKAITAKLNRSRAELEAERERQGRPAPHGVSDRPPPPVARPMPPRRPQASFEHRPVARPMFPQRPKAGIPRDIPPVMQTILDVVLDGAVDVEDVAQRPQPRRERPPAPPRMGKSTSAKRPVRRRSIEEREEQEAKLVEKRIGHVQPHIAKTPDASVTDTDSEWFERPTPKQLRRAIILSEILSPPLALRTTMDPS